METKVNTLKHLFAVAVTIGLAGWSTVASAAGGCPVWECGSNHNETLVRDRR